MLFVRLAGASALLFVGAAIAVDLPIFFEDVAPSSGLTVPNTSGGKASKDYILETTGNGVAIFDYDGDGAEDIFIANGTALQRTGAGNHLPQLYPNSGPGH